MNDFDYEVRQRKNLAHQAKYRKNGSKSKKCTLPSDRLTKAQLERKNGKVMTYHLGKPMTWAEFKYMPANYQKEYLENLHTKYGATQTDVAAMFGIAPNSLRNFCIRHNMDGIFHPSGRKSAAAIAKWQAFVNGEVEPEAAEQPVEEPVAVDEPVQTEEAAPEVPPLEDQEAVPEAHEPVIYPNVPKESAMKCELSFQMDFSGKFDLESFVRLISKHIDDGQEITLSIIGTIREA